MRFLIAGLGSIGERHFRNLRQLGFQDISVFRATDRTPRTLDGEKYRVFRSLDEALDEGPDVVLVTNPTHLHMEVALAVARRGHHLFIDIPISHSTEGTRELVDLVDKKQLVSLMGFNLRFHPCVHKIRELVLEGAIGRVLLAQAECATYLPDWHPWEDYRKGYAARRDMGGGAILAAGIHELDYLSWIFGPVDEVFSVTGTSGSLELQDVEDTASVVLKFHGGVVAELHCDLFQRPYSRWCKVVGDEGTIYWDFLENQVKLYRADKTTWELVLDLKGFDYNTTYLEEMRHLVECVEGRKQSINDASQGRQNLVTALAAAKAEKPGQAISAA